MELSSSLEHAVITPRQLKQGWHECFIGEPPIHHEWDVMAHLADGNYVVLSPSQSLNLPRKVAACGIEH